MITTSLIIESIIVVVHKGCLRLIHSRELKLEKVLSKFVSFHAMSNYLPHWINLVFFFLQYLVVKGEDMCKSIFKIYQTLAKRFNKIEI